MSDGEDVKELEENEQVPTEGAENEIGQEADELEAGVGGEVDKIVDDKPKEIPKFTLQDADADEPDGEGKDDDTTEIVHNGQVYTLTNDKIVELAQKGFDYDVKVGPHGKIAKMIESDPNLSKVVDDYWHGKVAGKEDAAFAVKSLDEYDNEEAWLQDNLNRAMEVMPKPTEVAPQKDEAASARDALQMRDPVFFNQVYSKMDKYAEQLTMADYRKVDSDMSALFQFYDFVKTQELGEAEKPNKPNSPGFRVKSGGGDPPKANDTPPAWKLSKKDFQKQLDKIKGYS